METPGLAMRMGAVLEDEACHEDFSIVIGRGDVLKHIPEYHIRFTGLITTKDGNPWVGDAHGRSA
jgi:hypothetical protein